MFRQPSPTYRLADVLLEGNLRTFVQEQRAAGRSWRWISHELWSLTDRQINVSDVTLRNWFVDGENGEAA